MRYPESLQHREWDIKKWIDTSFPKPGPYNIKRLGTWIKAGTHIGSVEPIMDRIKLYLVCSSLGHWLANKIIVCNM